MRRHRDPLDAWVGVVVFVAVLVLLALA